MKIFILFIVSLTVYGCATVGPTIVIETEEPAEDFVVLCKKNKSHLFKVGHTASKYTEVDHVIVTESGKEVSCGFMVGGTDGYVSVLHPILISDRNSHYTKDGVKHIVFNKTQLDILKEKKLKFKAGAWDKYRSPVTEYAQSFGSCGFGSDYINFYRKVKPIDKNKFFEKYNNFLLNCNQKVYKEVLKYDPAVAERSFNVSNTMKRIWSTERWRNDK